MDKKSISEVEIEINGEEICGKYKIGNPFKNHRIHGEPMPEEKYALLLEGYDIPKSTVGRFRKGLKVNEVITSSNMIIIAYQEIVFHAE